MVIIPILIYGFNAISTKSLARFYVDRDKLSPNFVRKGNGIITKTKTILKNDIMRGINLQNFKTYSNSDCVILAKEDT